MKICKKLLVLTLSVLLILGVIVIPNTAVESNAPRVTKYVSLLDLSTIPVGTTCTTGLPDGVTNLGISTFSASTIGHKFTSTQEIIEVEDGKKAWKLDVSAATTGSSNYYDIANKNNSFSIKFNVPTKYLPYIQGIRADFSTAVTGTVRYKFGVIDSSTYNVEGYASRFASKPGNWADGTFTKVTDNATQINNETAQKDITSLYICHQNQIQNGFATTDTALSEKWSEEDKESITNIYLCISRNSGTAGSGDYVIIKDIGITIEGTQEQLDSIPDTKTISIFDLSNNTVGATSIDYPEGITAGSYTGALQIAESKNTGKNAIRMDLENTEFTNKDADGDGLPDNGDRYNEFGYKPLYKLYFDVSVYSAYIDSINIQFNKQTTTNIRYNFGVSNGEKYSKIKGKDRNSTLASNLLGVQTVSLDTDNLYKCSEFQTGAYGTDTKDYWNNDFDRLFLYISAGYGADGYIDIEDVSITYTITAKDQADLDFKFARQKALIADFETAVEGTANGVASDNTASGEKAGYGSGAKQYKAGPTATINHNPNYKNATGLSYWVYNESEEDATIIAIFYSVIGETSTRFLKGVTAPSKKWTKVTVNFNDITKQISGDDWHEKSASYNYAMTPEEIAGITKVKFVNRKTTAVNFWIDDIYLEFDTKKQDAIINITSENTIVTDEFVTVEDGKAVFAPGADDKKEVVIDLPAGTLSGASMIEYHYTTKLSDGSTAPKVQLYANGPWSKTADTNWTDWAWQIKRGNNTASGRLEANATGVHLFDFSVISGNEEAPIHSWYGSSYGKNNYRDPKNASSPTEECLAAITQITFGVHPFGTADADEYVTLDKLVIKYKDTPYKATLGTVTNGQVELFKTTGNAGDIVQFKITPDVGCVVAGIKVRKTDGGLVELTDKYFDGQNINGLFAFEMPNSNVTVDVAFRSISSTISQYVEYKDNNAKLYFDIPVLDDMAYNMEADAYQVLEGYGVILACSEAFEKYGIDPQKLTIEQVKYFYESGHYLKNYVRYITEDEIIKSENSDIMISYSITINAIRALSRRANTTLITYADFKNGEGETVTDYEVSSGSFDKMVYGENLKESLTREQGFDYTKLVLPEMTEDNEALKPETWKNIAEDGYDHVVLSLDIAGCLDIKNVLIEEYMLKLDKILDNALRSGLCVVVKADNANNTDVAFEQLTKRYEKLPQSVVFEIGDGQ